MTDARLFTPEALRAQAVEVRRILMRLQNGDGEDRCLGNDVLLAIDAPTTMGDPTSSIDSAFHIARHLKQSPDKLPALSLLVLRSRRPKGEISSASIARHMTINILRIHLAKLERAPA